MDKNLELGKFYKNLCSAKLYNDLQDLVRCYNIMLSKNFKIDDEPDELLVELMTQKCKIQKDQEKKLKMDILLIATLMLKIRNKKFMKN